jgi:hypothetical protein
MDIQGTTAIISSSLSRSSNPSHFLPHLIETASPRTHLPLSSISCCKPLVHFLAQRASQQPHGHLQSRTGMLSCTPALRPAGPHPTIPPPPGAHALSAAAHSLHCRAPRLPPLLLCLLRNVRSSVLYITHATFPATSGDSQRAHVGPRFCTHRR